MFDNMQGRAERRAKSSCSLFDLYLIYHVSLQADWSWTSQRQLTDNIVIQPAPHQRAQLGGVSPQSCRRLRVVAVVAMLFSTTLTLNTLNNDRLPPHKSRALVGFSWLTL